MADVHKLAFLDVDINSSSGDFQTTVYRKPTNTGHCLNGRSECPDRYRLSVIRAYIHRALKHSSTWQLAHQELQRVRQILADNSYSQTTIDAEIQHAIMRFNQAAPAREGSTSETTYTLLYENQMSGAYKTDERILRGIIHRNCEPINPGEKLKLTVYYKSPKVSGLIMKNKLSMDMCICWVINVQQRNGNHCSRRLFNLRTFECVPN